VDKFINSENMQQISHFNLEIFTTT